MSRLLSLMGRGLLRHPFWSSSAGCNFSILDDKKLRVPVWAEFPGLPLPCWPFMQTIAQSIGKVVYLEPDHFLMLTLKRGYVLRSTFLTNWKKLLIFKWAVPPSPRRFFTWTYPTLLITSYQCQSVDHNIMDCPLASLKLKPLVKESGSRLVEGAKKDECTMVVCKGKTPVVSAQKTPVGSISQPTTDPPVQSPSSQEAPILVSNPDQ